MLRPRSARTFQPTSKNAASAQIGFEAKLWLAADKFRKNVDAADWSGATKTVRRDRPRSERRGTNQCNHIVLDLIILRFISDTVEEHHAGKRMMAEGRMMKSAPPTHSTSFSFCASTVAIEGDNPSLGVLLEDFARLALGTARRDRAFSKREASLQSQSAAKNYQRLGERVDSVAA